MLDYIEEAHTTVIMTELGIPVYFSKGSHANIKITNKEDLDLFLGYQLVKQYLKGSAYNEPYSTEMYSSMD